ncbi:DUF5695 domain-containing protein [Novisyntrophococcus fermenticellae]|uniref:DUF5695 domain-containing protein n=1 Tax=Novisyntrophococcus fermenticellae TaxID=2068655 RepID=UPI001E605D8C|nr:DUF5695 domain-containing protein [Novisyntrophococcus fermenticellae]
MQKVRHSYKQRAISLGMSTLLTLSMLGGSLPNAISAKAETNEKANVPGLISNDSLSVQIGDLGQISLMNIKNNRTNNHGKQVNFVLPNDTSPQNGVQHQWMGEMLFSYRTSKDGKFPEDRSGFVEVDTNKTLAAGGSTTYSDATQKLESNPYIKKKVVDDKKVEINYIGQDEDSTASRTMKGFDVKSVYDMETDDGSLLWEITLTNKSSNYIEFGDVGLPMPWNNKYTSQDSVYSERVTAHTFAGADSGYAYAIRCSGEGNYIMFTPVPESGARIEYIDNWVGNNNQVSGERAGNLFTNWTSDSGGWQPGLNVYYIHSKDIQKTGRGYYTDATSLVLAPEQSKTYQFKFSAVRAGDNTPQESAASANNASNSMEERESNMRSVLYNSGMIDAVAVPGFQTAINMPVKLDLHYDNNKIQVQDVDIQCVHENDPFDANHIPEKKNGMVNNSRGGRGTHDGNPDYKESCKFVEEKLVNGEWHHIYDLTFGCLGNNSIRVNYKLKVGDQWVDKFTQFEFNVLAELDESIETHSDFMVNNQQDNNPDSPTYGIYNDWYFASGVDQNAKNHWGDDWSHDNINFMTMKNYLDPDPEEIESIERYLIDFMWENYMKYTQENYTVANYLSGSGIYGSSQAPYNRTFSEVMEATGFFNMYRIQKAYPDLIDYRESPRYYLDKAYNIYYNRVGTDAIGFYGEQQVPDIIEALRAEGMTDEAGKLQKKFAYDKGSNMTRATYPYGSEFVYDNTGEEGAYAAAKALRTYYPNDSNAANALGKMEMAEWKTRAMRGLQPTWYQYADPVFIGGENWWNFQYTASLAGSIMDDWLRYQDNGWDTDSSAWAQRVNYAAKLSNFNAINMGQISEKYIGNVSWRYTMYKGGHGAMNVNDGGTRVMNNGWNDFSGESDEGLYGSLLSISSDVVTDPVFGVVGYGSTASKEGDRYTIVPKDGIGKRINVLDDKVYLTLEQDSCTEAVIDASGTYFDLTLKCLTDTSHLSRISLSGSGVKDGFYSIKLNGEAAGQCYIKNNKGTANVMIAGTTAQVTIEKMDGGENEAPAVKILTADEKLQALVPFDVKSSAYDDGAWDGSLTYTWAATKIPEGAAMTFAEPNMPNTQAVGSKEGEYVIALTVSDGTLKTTAEKTVTLEAAPDRAAPTIGEVTAVQDPVNLSVASLNGEAKSDPLYHGELKYKWSVLEQPEGGNAVIGNADQASAVLKASKPGTYVVRFTAIDADVSAYKDITLKMTGEVNGVERGVSVMTKEGTAPELPAEVEVILPDGSVIDAEVEWAAVNPEKYEKKGSFTAEGTVKGSEQKVAVTVYVVSGNKQNLATVANAAAIINSVQDLGGVASLNNGVDPSSSGDTSNGAWHNWLGDQGGPAWVQYTWEGTIIADSMDVYVFRDGGGNFQPKDMQVKLRDENGNWYTPRNVSGLENKLNKYNTTTFEAARITGIRIDMKPVGLGCGILEWKVYGYGEGLTDKTELKKVYNQVNSLKASQLVDGLNPVKDANAAADIVLKNNKATQEEVDKALSDLLMAMKNLKPKSGNLAYVAGLTASFTSGWESLPAVRDGVKLSGGHWGTWGNASGSEWLEYSWPAGVSVVASDLYIWNDGGGIQTPKSYAFTYLPMDSDEWVPLKTVNKDIKANAMNHIKFENPVEARALRCTLEKPAYGSDGIGVWEWEVYTTVDKSGLEAVLGQAEQLKEKESYYTADTWAAFLGALNTAAAVSGDQEAYQDTVDGALKDLQEKIAALVEVPKVTEITIKTQPGKLAYLPGEELDLTGMVLEAAYEDGNTKLISDLGLIQADGFDSALVGSQSITISYTENGATVTAVLDVNVMIPVDMTALNLAITMGEEMEREQEANNPYTPESFLALQAALDEARAVAADEHVTQSEVDTAFRSLITAYANLEYGTANYGLKAAISGTKAILEDPVTDKTYTEASIQAVRDALAYAEAVAGNVNASQDEINAATRDLITAVNSMLEKEDSRLKKLIQTVEQILENEEKYTGSSITNLKEALDAAKAVEANPNATDSEADEAYKHLLTALSGLKLKGNKTELQNMVNKAAEILADREKYVEASLEGLDAANTKAVEVLDDENAVQSEINEALKGLVRELLEARLLGDVNGDGKVDTADSALLLKYTAELTDLSKENLDAADVNRDQKQDTKDVTQILKLSAEMIDSFRN